MQRPDRSAAEDGVHRLAEALKLPARDKRQQRPGEAPAVHAHGSAPREGVLAHGLRDEQRLGARLARHAQVLQIHPGRASGLAYQLQQPRNVAPAYRVRRLLCAPVFRREVHRSQRRAVAVLRAYGAKRCEQVALRHVAQDFAAEVTGYGLSCDAHHITAPDPDGDGAYRAMAMAVKKSGWQPEEIDLINAHGTSTPLNDKMETMAIKRLLGEDNAKKVLVHSTKSMVGHALGAAGAIETIATLLAIDKGIVHPTINQITPDPDCDLNTVPNKAAEAKVDRAIINNFGFGGHNGVLAIQSCKD